MIEVDPPANFNAERRSVIELPGEFDPYAASWMAWP
jgi:hypothetical protein